MDGRKGLAKHGPYDVIHVGASINFNALNKAKSKVTKERKKESYI